MLNTLLITFGLDVVLTYLAQLLSSRRLPHHQSELCRGQLRRSRADHPARAACGLRRRLSCSPPLSGCCCASCRSAAPSAPRRRTCRGAALRRQPAPALCDHLRHRRGAGRRGRRALRHDLAPDALCRRQPDREVLRHRHHRRADESVLRHPRRPLRRHRRIADRALSSARPTPTSSASACWWWSWSCARPLR